MKDSEFLELLNLYLDHEITAADAARLEAEVQNSGERRAIYRDYCRMQKACRIMAADLQIEASGARATVGTGKVVAFGVQPAARMSRKGLYLAASVTAAAACVVFILGNGRWTSTETGTSARAQVLAEASTVPPASRAGAQLAAVGDAAQRGLRPAVGGQEAKSRPTVSMVADSLVLSGGRQADAALLAAGSEGDDQLGWIRSFQLVSLQERKNLENLRFEVSSPSLRPEARQLGARASTEATVEMAAFRFIK